MKGLPIIAVSAFILSLAGCQPAAKTEDDVLTPETLRGSVSEQLRPETPDAWTGRKVTLVAMPELSDDAINALLEPFGRAKGLLGRENAEARDELLRTLTAFAEQSLTDPGPGDLATDESYADQARNIVAALVMSARLHAEEKRWKDASENLVRAADFTKSALESCVTEAWQDVVPARAMTLDGIKNLAAWPGLPKENLAQLKVGTKPVAVRDVMINATRANFVGEQVDRIAAFQKSKTQLADLAAMMARFGDPEEYETFLRDALTDARNPFHAKKTIERASSQTVEILDVAMSPWPQIEAALAKRDDVIAATWGKNPFETPAEKLDAADAKPRLVEAQNPVGELIAWEVTQNLRFLLELAIVADAQESATQIALATRSGTKIGNLPIELKTDPLTGQLFIINEKSRTLRSPLKFEKTKGMPGMFVLGLVDPGIGY